MCFLDSSQKAVVGQGVEQRVRAGPGYRRTYIRLVLKFVFAESIFYHGCSAVL